MKQHNISWQWMLMVGAAAMAGGLAGGCRARVQRVQMERIDQEPGGNRGYLLGTPSAAAQRKPTREIAELEVHLPSAVPATSGRAVSPTPMEEPSAPATNWSPSTTQTPSNAPAADPAAEWYTVKKGDTLWSIAHTMYGKGSLWSRIFDANRDQLPSPNRLRPGMRLYIPRDGAGVVDEK